MFRSHPLSNPKAQVSVSSRQAPVGFCALHANRF